MTKKTMIYRESSPIFPMGFRYSMSKDFCIIDFIDMPDDDTMKVTNSIAISKSHAKILIENLNRFINEDDEK